MPSSESMVGQDSHPVWIEQFIKKVTEIQRKSQDLLSVPGVADLCVGLDQALQRFHATQSRTVLSITFLGASGVGKSTLFNALIERPEASPVSHDVRCFTKRPYVAVHPGDRRFLYFPEELEPTYIDFSVRGLALCDTPDISGVLTENRHVARRLIEESDVLIYVTMPERRADFDVAEEIRRWAVRKRWLFVLNRMDEVRDRKAVREDFYRRLRELGFHPDENSVFLISANKPDDPELLRLRKALFSIEPKEIARSIKYDAFLGALQYVVSSEQMQPIKSAAEQLLQSKTQLEEEVREIYREGLREPMVAGVFQRMVTEATWRHLVDRSWGFSALISWVRWRWSRLRLAYSLLRIGTSMGSLYSLMRGAANTLAILLSNYLPAWQVNEALETHCGPRLESLKRHIRRVLEDHGLIEWAETISAGSPPDNSQTADPSTIPAWLRPFQRFLESRDPFGSVATLRNELERTGHLAAKKAGSWWCQLVVNALPVLITVDFMFRLAQFWWRSAPYFDNEPVFPTSSFYILAAVMMAASILPGYVMLSHRVTRFSRRVDTELVLKQITDFPVLGPLSSACDTITQLLDHCRQLTETAAQFRRSLRIQLAGADGPSHEADEKRG